MSEQDKYTSGQMKEIIQKIDEIQMSYDTRLVAALLAGRSAYLYAIMIRGGVIPQDEAQQVWKKAGETIDTPPDKDVKVATLSKETVFDTDSVN